MPLTTYEVEKVSANSLGKSITELIYKLVPRSDIPHGTRVDDELNDTREQECRSKVSTE